jgi:hypothetical protein
MARLSVEANAVFSHWHHPLANFKMSTEEFYRTVEQALYPHQIPDTELSRIEWQEGGVLSARRGYLRVRRGPLVFDICAAPFGADYFFSWWLAEIPPRHGLLRLMAILFGSLVALIILTRIFMAMLNDFLGAVIGFPLALAALPFVLWVVGYAVHNGTFGPGAEEALIATPVFGWMYVKLFGPFTYYKIDTKLMFQSAVHSAVLAAVDQVTASKGLRALTELERKPLLREFYER